MNKKIRKAVIPAAGLGTRFLPATKALPKEMLPIVDTPTIHYIVEEAIKSGIEDFLIITNGTKDAMENYFDINFELETRLKQANKEHLANEVHQIAEMANIYYIRQKEPKGLGHAILCAKDFVGDEPFAVLLGDDLVVNWKNPALSQLISAFEKTKATILGVQEVPHNEVNKYGIVKPVNLSDKGPLIKLNDFVEKPNIDSAPSNYAVLGRYILTPNIFKHLENTLPGVNGEIQLTDAIKANMKEEELYAYNFEGTRYDIGDKFGYMKANIDFSLNNPEISSKVKQYIVELAKQFSK